MKQQWYDPARKASGCEPGCAVRQQTQEIPALTHAAKDRPALRAPKEKIA